jgi:hypothetical protein
LKDQFGNISVVTKKSWCGIKRILKILVFTLLWYHPSPHILPFSSVSMRGTWTILDQCFVPISLQLLPSMHRDVPWSKLRSAWEALHVK